MFTSEKVWLYRLTIKIRSGTQLPIADLTSSDPFVIVDLNERNVGKTKTVYRNREPVWDTTFSDIQLTHIEHTICFRVMDEDRDKNDDPMGSVTLPLKSDLIKFNVVNELTRSLEQIEGSKIIASGSISFSIFLERNEQIFKLSKSDVANTFYNPINHPALEQELQRVNLPDSVLSTLKTWDGQFITIDNQNFIRDLLLDVCSVADLVKKTANTQTMLSTGAVKSIIISSAFIMKPVSQIPSAISSSFYTNSGKYVRSAPSKELKVVIRMKNGERHILLLSSRIALWRCVRALRYSIDVANRKTSDIPSWARDGVHESKDVTLYFNFPSIVSSPYKKLSGTLRIYFSENPLTLKLHTADKNIYEVKISEIENYLVTNNSRSPGKYLAQLEIVACELVCDNSELSNVKDDFLSLDPHYRFYGDVKALQVEAENTAGHSTPDPGPPIVSSPGGWCLGFLCGTVKQTTTNTAQIAVITAGAVSDVVSTVSDAFKDSYHVSVRCAGSSYRTADRFLAKQMVWQESLYVDFTLDAGNRDDEGSGIYFFVYKSHTGLQDALIGVKYLNIGECLLQNKLTGNLTLEMNDRLEFNVSINSMEIYTSTAPNVTANDSSTSFFGSCKYGKANGAKVKRGPNKPLRQIFRSKDLSTCNFDFQDYSFILTDSEGLEEAEYVRFDVRFSESGAHKEERLASCFIPIEKFTSSSIEETFPLVLLNDEGDNANKLSAKGFVQKSGSYGMVKLSFSRNVVARAEKQKVPKVNVRFNIVEQNIISTWWTGFSVFSSSDECHEKFIVSSGFDGILFLDNKDPAMKYGRRIRNEKTDPSTSIDHDEAIEVLSTSQKTSNITETFSDLGDTVQIYVFENQRNFLTAFKKENLGGLDFPSFSDDKGNTVAKVDSITEILPPYGYYWNSDWSVDIDFDQNADEDGWRYASDFKTLSKPQKRGLPNKSLGLVRSRRWVRRAQKIQTDSVHRRNINQNLIYLEYDETSSDPTLKQRSSLWRDIILRETPNKVLACCGERSSMTSVINIPYDQVQSYSVVTDTILSLTVTINKYIGSPGNIPQFRPIDIEIFVENCPADSIKYLLDERLEFSKIRRTLRDVFKVEREGFLKERNIRKTPSLTKTVSLSYDLRSTRSKLLLEDETDLSKLSELSLGCTCMQELDDIYVKLKSLVEHGRKSNFPQNDLETLERRLLRIKMYYSLLIGVSSRLLFDKSKFNTSDIKNIISKDLSICSSIQREDEIELSVNRMEFLFDAAESRLLDYSLHGWGNQGTINLSDNVFVLGPFEQAIQTMLNGYYIELVGLVGKYFEFLSESKKYLKGLHKKIVLLLAFMKYNDRLEVCLTTATRLYNLVPDVPPRLSSALNFNILRALYSDILQDDMMQAVESAANVWRDADKNASGNKDVYKFSLPWIPMRSRESSGYFYTLLCQDAINFLKEYLSYARVDEEGVAPSFRPLLAAIESRCQLAFAWALKYLCDLYWKTMSESLDKWCDKAKVAFIVKDQLSSLKTASSKESIYSTDELVFNFLDEKTDWLCSVANDAYRVENSSLISIPPNPKSKSLNSSAVNSNPQESSETIDMQTLEELKHRTDDLLKDASMSFHHLQRHAIDALCCTTMLQLSLEHQSLFDTPNLYIEWKKRINPIKPLNEITDQSSAFEASTFISDFISSLVDEISKKQDSLLEDSYIAYMEMCLDKVISMFYLILIEANNLNVKWSWHHPEVTQLFCDVCYLRKKFEKLGSPTQEAVLTTVEDVTNVDITASQRALGITTITLVAARMVVLEHAILFIRSKQITVTSLQESFEPVLAVAPFRKAVASEMANLLEVAVSLRFDPSIMTNEEITNHEKKTPERRSTGLFSKFRKSGDNLESLDSHDTHEKKQSDNKAKRGSLLSAFGLGHHEDKSQPSHTESNERLSRDDSSANSLNKLIEASEINAANAADEQYKHVKYSRSDIKDEPVDSDVIQSFISSISVWKFEEFTNNTGKNRFDNQEPSSFQSSVLSSEIKTCSHFKYYFCSEVLIYRLIYKRDILIRGNIKTPVQALLLLSAFSPTPKEEVLVTAQSKPDINKQNLPKPPKTSSASNASAKKDIEYVIEISNFYISNMFFVDSSKPSVYIDFTLPIAGSGPVHEVTAQSTIVHDSSAPDWRREKPVEIVLSEATLSAPFDSESLIKYLNAMLIAKVRFKGHLFGHLDVGQVKVPISSIDINQVKEEFVIDTTDADPKAQKGAKKALSLPGGIPAKMGLTVRLLQRKHS